MKETQDKLERWYRLDNSADIYPMSLSRTVQSNFRLTVTLNDDINPEALKDALNNAYSRYPAFKVHLRKGFFRYYFEENELQPRVFPESGVFFETIDFKKNNRYLIKVSYFGKRISVDFFHGLTDGTGALEFLKTLVYLYLKEIGKELINPDTIKIPGDEVSEAENEDSTAKYYRDFALNDDAVGNMTGNNSVYIKQKMFARPGYGSIIALMNSSEVRTVAKRYDATVTELVASLALLSIHDAYLKKKDNKHMAVMIPVNLRKIFPSETLNNFTTMIRCEVNQNVIPPDLSAYIRVIKKGIREGVADKDLLQKKLSVAALMSEKMYLRLMPSRLKTLFIKVPKTFLVKPRQTLIVSNLGFVPLPADVSREIDKMTFHVNISKKTPLNIGIVSSNDIMSISFTRMTVSTEVERVFLTRLAHEGVNISVLSNNREESDAEERKGKAIRKLRQTYYKAKWNRKNKTNND